MEPRAAVFDVMGTLFDLTALRPRIEELGAPGTALEAWFERTLHAAAALTLVGRFSPFSEIATRSLETTLVQLGLDPSPASDVVGEIAGLPPYPDGAAALETLGAAGVRVAALSNGSAEQTEQLLARAGLCEGVEQVLSTASVEAYKPHRAPYDHAVEALGLASGHCTVVAAHAWDCLGARGAGLGAVWVDRLELRWPLPVEETPSAGSLAEAADLLVRDENTPR